MKKEMDLTYGDFHKIVINEWPLIDVRAPVEFEKGAFRKAVNLPIMNDEERALVGTCYKQQGADAAVRLGHQLVSGKKKAERIMAWKTELAKDPNTLLYCFRGGMRSRITQQWIQETSGLEIPRLQGGYKAFRNYLLAALEPAAQTSRPVILTGYTGAGKTILLRQVAQAIDLEGLANHRGSTFGQYLTPQPSQIDFENNLAYKLIQHKENGWKHMILEDEGRHIGKCFLPKALAEFFAGGAYVLLESPMEDRTELTLAEYVVEAQKRCQSLFGPVLGLQKWYGNMGDSMERIRKRLGGDRYKELMTMLAEAFHAQIKTEKFDGHRGWIEFLLREYYDPLYLHQMSSISDRLLFRGNAAAVGAYLQQLE